MSTPNRSVTNPLVLPEFVAGPYAHYAKLRAEDPVHWSETFQAWILTRHDDVLAVLADKRFSARRVDGVMMQLEEQDRPKAAEIARFLKMWMVMEDPPVHTRLRNLANRAFTPRVVENLRAWIEQLSHDLVDAVAASGRMDLIADFAYPLPVTVIAKMLGAPREDRERFKKWSDDIAGVVGASLLTLDVALKGQESALEFAEYFRGLVAERRAAPKDDLLSALLRAEEAGDVLGEDELIATCILLLAAGHETTTNLIGNGMLALLQHPEQLELLRREPALIGTAVEEMLRFDSPVQFTMRTATEEVEVGGTTIRTGQRVFAMIGAANRDPAHYADPDRFDVTRTDAKHVSLGHGIHYCIGGALARLEARIAIGVLLRRLPGLRLESAVLEWHDNVGFHGLERLPVVF